MGSYGEQATSFCALWGHTIVSYCVPQGPIESPFLIRTGLVLHVPKPNSHLNGSFSELALGGHLDSS